MVKRSNARRQIVNVDVQKNVPPYLNVYLLSLGIIFFLYFFIYHYLNLDLASTLSFQTNDTWCVGHEPVFGSHCFGDFGLSMQQVALNHQVWTQGTPTPYAASVFMIYAFFNMLLKSFGYGPTISIYLLLLALSMILPIYYSTRKRVDSSQMPA
jgi:phosphatidylserine synthase